MWKERIEELMRENKEHMMHSEEPMRKLRNTDNSGHYVRQRTHNVLADALRSHQYNKVQAVSPKQYNLVQYRFKVSKVSNCFAIQL